MEDGTVVTIVPNSDDNNEDNEDNTEYYDADFITLAIEYLQDKVMNIERLDTEN